jgi:hypothetical protein
VFSHSLLNQDVLSRAVEQIFKASVQPPPKPFFPSELLLTRNGSVTTAPLPLLTGSRRGLLS